MIVSLHELRLAELEARLASLERRLSALPEPTSGRTYHRHYAFEQDAPGVAEQMERAEGDEMVKEGEEMGLDTTHDCWHGAYSAFQRWREELARIAGVPLGLMEGYWSHGDIGLARFAGYLDEVNRIGPAGYFVAEYVAEVDKWLPIKWSSIRPDVLHVLLDHSDCDGWIAAEFCAPLADRLAELLPLLPEGSGGGHIGDWRDKTQRFVDGLRLAASQGERVVFH